MKLKLPFLKRTANEPVVSADEPAKESVADAVEEDPVDILSKKVCELEGKIGECEKAMLDENLELKRRIEEINRANRESSAGSVRGTQSDYFSYSEVKEMTPEQVRKNFSRIVDSMGKWN